MPSTVTREPTTVARLLLRAIVGRDDPELRSLFSDDVWLRAMLVRQTIEAHGHDAVVDVFEGWFGNAHEVQVLHASTHVVGTRHRLTYRLRLRPGWAPDVWHVIEQTGYARVEGGHVRRVDIVCTGFVPEADVAGEGTA